MALWVIGDLHLSLGAEKPMDVFGGAWDGYVEKLTEGLKVISPEDTTVLLGDLSWGMSMADAAPDFHFIDEHIPGRKLIVKGNHDYWWTTATQAYRFFGENGFDSLEILNNNCYFYEDLAICGTRGWSCDAMDGDDHDQKILRRELMRLETSLKAAGEREKLVFLHYPPKLLNAECGEMLALMRDYGVKRCWYGHLHSGGCAIAFEGEACGIRFQLVSADHLRFFPQKIF
jgi:predicted phosphohydrolase